ncbi:MAG: hypothetical protein CME61_03630 [Halobacteriovoraceae bacterium]|nr:hypothetical protein [Halobacteriovoraceae bacterium]|tara:strand:+ start:287 stop:781 length:495 start_codon:yes stop_codon:yes gene_type:complete
MRKTLKAIDNAIEKGTLYLLIGCVMVMLFLSVTNIFLRWFDMTIYWVEPLVRHLVFLSAFLGGVLATGSRKHIGIDIFQRWLEENRDSILTKLTLRLTSLVSIVTLVWLTVSSYDFVVTELKYGQPIFWGIHSGFLVGIIPFGFSLILIRFLIIFINSFYKVER